MAWGRRIAALAVVCALTSAATVAASPESAQRKTSPERFGPRTFHSELRERLLKAETRRGTVGSLCGLENVQNLHLERGNVVEGEESGPLLSTGYRSLSIWEAMPPWLRPLVFAALLLASVLRWRQTRSGVAALFCIACVLALTAGVMNLPFKGFLDPRLFLDRLQYVSDGPVTLAVYESLRILAAIAAGAGAVTAIAALIRGEDSGSEEAASRVTEGP